MKAAVWVLFALLGMAAGGAEAKPWWLRGVESNDTDFLPPDAAFRVGAEADGHVIRVRWIIANGYYLYCSKITATAESPDLLVSEIALPRGKVKTDPYLGTNEIFTSDVEGQVRYRQLDYGAHPIQIKVTYQGCADAGLCYPMITKVLLPGSRAQAVADRPSHRPPVAALVGGVLAFLLAGLVLRRERTLERPAS